MSGNDIVEEQVLCSFCGKSQDEVKKIIAGSDVYICDECTLLCSEIIRDETIGDEGKYIHQILTGHFRYANKTAIESLYYETSTPNRICPESIINQWLKSNNYTYKRIGVSRKYHGRDKFLSFSELWEEKIYPVYLGPVQYQLTGLSRDNSKILKNGLWLCSNEQIRFVIYMEQGLSTPKDNNTILYFEIASAKEVGLDINKILSEIVQTVDATDDQPLTVLILNKERIILGAETEIQCEGIAEGQHGEQVSITLYYHFKEPFCDEIGTILREIEVGKKYLIFGKSTSVHDEPCELTFYHPHYKLV